MGRPAEDRVHEQDVETVEIGADVRVLRKGDDLAATVRLGDDEGLEGKLLAILLPDITARQQVVGRAEARHVDALVPGNRRIDVAAAYQHIYRRGGTRTEPMIGIDIGAYQHAGNGIRVRLPLHGQVAILVLVLDIASGNRRGRFLVIRFVVRCSFDVAFGDGVLATNRKQVDFRIGEETRGVADGDQHATFSDPVFQVVDTAFTERALVGSAGGLRQDQDLVARQVGAGQSRGTYRRHRVAELPLDDEARVARHV